jgi:hypothetical protein
LSLVRVVLLAVVLAISLAATADAARIPTAQERAALEQLLRGQVGDDCRHALKQSSPLPLVTDDGTWGTASTVCLFSDPPSGAGTSVWTVYAHRSSGTSSDWAVVRPSRASRVPACIGADGLFTTVPEPVVRELREVCANPSASHGYEPIPYQTLRIFRNRRHEYDMLGPEVDLDILSESKGHGPGFFSLTKNGPAPGSRPTLKRLREAFGTSRRNGCQDRWRRVGLTATACHGRVTKLTLRGPWLLTPDSEAPVETVGPEVEIGDAVPLARYLDARLAKLPADGRLRLPRMRIGKARVTVSVVTRNDHITAIEIAIRRVP